MLFIFLMAGVAPAIPVVTTSSSGRFQITGSDVSENTDYTRWAEDLAARLERISGREIPVPRGFPVEIVLDDTRLSLPQVTADISLRDRAEASLRERNAVKCALIIRQSHSVDTDLLREGFIQLMLAEVVDNCRREEGLAPIVPQFPKWFTVGLAQNLDSEGVARNRKIAASSGQGVDAVAASEAVGWSQLPEGWHGQQAVCGLVTAWILSFPGGMDALIDRLAVQEPVTAEWLATRIVRVETVSKMDSQWRGWRQRQGSFIQEFGGLSSEMIGRLRRELPLDVEAVVPGSNIRRAVTLCPDEVIAARKRIPGVRMMAFGKMERIQMVTMGKAPELVEVGELYSHFYEGVGCGAWSITLKRRLARAEAALNRLDQLTRAREAYLDAVEAEWDVRGLSSQEPAGAMMVPELEKSRIESYLDEAEKRFHKP